MALTLTIDERAELQRRVRSLKIRSEDARRARVILMLADGESYSTIEAAIPCYRDYINRWRRRFLASRLEGLRPRYCGSTPNALLTGLYFHPREFTIRGARRLDRLPASLVYEAPSAGRKSRLARWQSGYAGDCKSPYIGSIPVRASTV